MANRLAQLEQPTNRLMSLELAQNRLAELEPVSQAEDFLETSQQIERPGLAGRTVKGFINKVFVQPVRTIIGKGGLGETAITAELLEQSKKGEDVFKDVPQLRTPFDIFRPSVLNAIKEATRPAERKVELEVAQMVPGFEVPPAETIPEKGVEVVTGVAAFVTKLAVAKKFLGGKGFAGEVAAFELVNQVEAGVPGMGALLAVSLGGVGKIPAATLPGKGLKLVGQGGVLAGLTTVGGGSPEDIAVAFVLPAVLRTFNQFPALVRGKRFDIKLAKDVQTKVPFMRDVPLKTITKWSAAMRDALEVRKGNMTAERWGAKHGTNLTQFSDEAVEAFRKSGKPVPVEITGKVPAKPIVKPVQPTPEHPAAPKVGVKPEIGIKVPPKPIQAKPEAKKPLEVAPVAEGKEIFTSAPQAWKKEETLVDWGKKGIRNQGNRALSAGVGKKTRKTFVWTEDLAELPTRLPRSTIDAFKARTEEIWKLQRRGKGEDVWLVPKVLKEQLEKELGVEAFVRRPKPERSPKQKLNDVMNSMRARDVDPTVQGEVILDQIKDLGLKEADLTDVQKEFIEDFRNEQRRQEAKEAIRPRVEQKVLTEEELERIAIQEEADAGEIGDFLDGILEEEPRPKDLIGRPVLRGGVAGEQAEFLEKEKFKLPEPDIEGQRIFTAIGATRDPTTDRLLQKAVDSKKFSFIAQVKGKPKLLSKRPKSGDFIEISPIGETKVVKGKKLFEVESEAISEAQFIADNTKNSVFVTDTVKGFAIVETLPKVDHVEIKPAGVGVTKAEREVLTRQKIAELEILQQAGKEVGFKAGRARAIVEGRAKIKLFQLAEKLTEKNRTDALDVVRQFVPKEKQERFTKRILAAKTSKRVDRITEAVQLFINRAEKMAAVRDFKGFLSKTNREFSRGEVRLGKLPADIREKVLEVVDKFDPIKLSEAKRKQLEKRDIFIKRVSGTVADAFESLEEEAVDILQIPNARITELERLSKIHIGTLSTEQVNYIRVSLEHLIQIARKRADVKEVTRSERVAKQVNAARQEVSQRGKQEGIIEQPTGVSGLFGQVFVQGQSSIRTMTGRATIKDNKATMELLVENIQEAKRVEKAIIKEFSEASAKAFEDDLKFTQKNSAQFDRLIPIKLGGKRFKIDVDNLFSIYMHIKAEGNLRQLLKSEGLNITVVERNPKVLNVIKSKKQVLTGRVQLSELREVIKIIEAIPKFQELSETTFKINKDVVSPKVNETSIAFQNFPIARKDKYWPQPRSLVKNVEGRATDVSVAIEQQGMFLPKRGGTARLLIRPYRSQFVNILQTSAQFSASTLPMRDAKALLGNKKWQDNMRKSGRGAELKGIITMFRRMQGLSTDKAFVDQAGAKLLNNFGKSVLSLRLSGYGVQTASVPASYEFIDPKYFKTTEAIRKIARVPEKDVQEMENLSPTLWVRWKARQFNYVTGGVAAQNSFNNMILGKTPLLDKFLNQYTWGDQKAIKIIFDATQNKVVAEQDLKKGTAENKKAAIKETERALETQPNWDIVYRSPLTSSPNVFLRGSLMFLAARNAQMNVLMRAVDDFNKGRIGVGEAGKRMRGVLYANILVAIVKRLLKLGIKGAVLGLLLVIDDDVNIGTVGKVATKEGIKDVKRLPQDVLMNIIGLAAFGTIPATIARETIRSFKRPTSSFRKIADIRTGNFFADLSLDVTAAGISAGALGKHLLTQEKISRGPRVGRPKWRDDAENLSLAIAELISIRYGLPLVAPKQELLFQMKAALRAIEKEGKQEERIF